MGREGSRPHPELDENRLRDRQEVLAAERERAPSRTHAVQ